jgi:cytochrome P450
MNIFPSPEQQLNPFQFYADMRHNNAVAYDDKNNVWGVFRYYDVQFILGDYTHFSSNPPPRSPPKSDNIQDQEKEEKMPFTRPSLLKSDPELWRWLKYRTGSGSIKICRHFCGYS